MSNQEARSPMTKQMAEFIPSFKGYVTYRHVKEGIGDLNISERAVIELQQGLPFGYSRQRGYSQEDTDEALDLIRSYMWRVRDQQEKRLLVTTIAEQNDLVSKFTKDDQTNPFLMKPMEEFITEARALTPEMKAFQTLQNLHRAFRKNPTNNDVRYAHKVTEKYDFRPDPQFVEDGFCYGCNNLNGYATFQYLEQEGLIEQRWSNNSFLGLQIIHKGLAKLDEMRKVSKPYGRSAFFVRKVRLGDELNSILFDVMSQVGERLRCPIKAVWEDEHIDRIDERIFRLIRECPITVVHVSNDNFNVGLEMGYAMALGKPVVCIRETPPEDAEPWQKALPFDVYTLNCYDYDRNNPKALIDILEARIGLALDLLKMA